MLVTTANKVKHALLPHAVLHITYVITSFILHELIINIHICISSSQKIVTLLVRDELAADLVRKSTETKRKAREKIYFPRRRRTK